MNNKQLHGGHAFSGLFVFLLIGAFAIASITLVLSGINVYRHVTNVATDNTDKQIALGYLGNKIHAYDEFESIRLETRDGIEVLCLLEELDGEAYETCIYYYDGAICEQFTAVGGEFRPVLGEALTEVRSIQFEMLRPNLLQVKVALPDGNEHTLHMALRSSQVR